eukprot:342048-Hanusia_phi.AAC.1
MMADEDMPVCFLGREMRHLFDTGTKVKATQVTISESPVALGDSPRVTVCLEDIIVRRRVETVDERVERLEETVK